MMTTSVSRGSTAQEKDLFRAISITTLFTGLLTYAALLIIYYLTVYSTGNNGDPSISFLKFISNGGPLRLAHQIASAAFGNSASFGEPLMIAWGIVFHFVTAFLFTCFYFLVYPYILRFMKAGLLVAFFYGSFTWIVMYELILPFTRLNLPSFELSQILATLGLLGISMGLPVTVLAQRFYSRKA